MGSKPVKNGDEPTLRMRGYGWQANPLPNSRPFDLLHQCHNSQKCVHSIAVTFA